MAERSPAEDVRFMTTREDTLYFPIAPLDGYGKRTYPIGYLVLSLPIARAIYSGLYVSRTGCKAPSDTDADRWIRRAMQVFAFDLSTHFYIKTSGEQRDERWEASPPDAQTRLERTVAAAAFRDKHNDDAAQLTLLHTLSAPLSEVLRV